LEDQRVPSKTACQTTCKAAWLFPLMRAIKVPGAAKRATAFAAELTPAHFTCRIDTAATWRVHACGCGSSPPGSGPGFGRTTPVVGTGEPRNGGS
jgi:hypothetical protein